MSDRVILKPLTRWNEAYKEFPRYVMEYLCARFVDPKEPLPGQQKIDRILEEHCVESGKKELIKSWIREQGEYTFLGQLTLSNDQRTDHYGADVPALGDNHVRVSERVKRKFGDILLTTGAWGTMRVEFDGTYELRGRKYPFCISDYLAEIFRFLRRRNFQTHVTAHVVFDAWTGRDQDAVQKTAAGLLKLMYPHRTPEDIEFDELRFCVDLAVEMRRRVTDQLRMIAPKEFTYNTFEFRLNGH